MADEDPHTLDLTEGNFLRYLRGITVCAARGWHDKSDSLHITYLRHSLPKAVVALTADRTWADALGLSV